MTESNKIVTNVSFGSSCTHLFAAAQELCIELPSENHDSVLGIILLAFASFEAFLNEMGLFFPNDDSQESGMPIQVRRYMDEFNKLGERAPARDKYELAYKCFCEAQMDKGREPWQSIGTLEALRNELMHSKVESRSLNKKQVFQWSNHKLLRSLECKGLIDSELIKMNLHWISMIKTKRLGKWACDTVSQAIRELIGFIEIQSNWNELYFDSYFKFFCLIEDVPRN